MYTCYVYTYVIIVSLGVLLNVHDRMYQRLGPDVLTSLAHIRNLMNTYVYICIYIHTCICVYIYIYVVRCTPLQHFALYYTISHDIAYVM